MLTIRRRTPFPSLFSPLFEELAFPFRDGTSTPHLPPTDLVEVEDEIRISVELPGLRSEDIEISIEEDLLTISGERQVVTEEGDDAGRIHLSERRWGRFVRSFRLPGEVDRDAIAATFEDGVLMLTLPKVSTAKVRRIEIRNGGRREVTPTAEK